MVRKKFDMSGRSTTSSYQFGVTPPVSTNFPVEAEVLATAELVQVLRDFGQYESEEEAQLRLCSEVAASNASREVVLAKLDAIFKDFVRIVSIRNGLPESLAATVGGKIFTFGSYRLGVHGKASDIDTLCVAPKHIKREDFLDTMYHMLKDRPEVSEATVSLLNILFDRLVMNIPYQSQRYFCTLILPINRLSIAVPEAYVPVIKLCFSGIQIDLVFAKLSIPAVKEDLDLSDDKLLNNLDERCIRSLNGSRVTDDILRLVPNAEAFRIALRCIKLWAKQKAIYSNVMGFFGGVAWAIVTARVCQLYPNAAAGAIIAKFFRIMVSWEWPQPVILKNIEQGSLAVRVWNPAIYAQDKSHRMPVITPSYPSMCSTHNVTSSTQAVTTEEFANAADIADKIMLGLEKWPALFKKNDFFHRYKYYLQVVATSNNPDQYLKWFGMVESRLRQLVNKLEVIEMIERAHPFIKAIEREAVCRTAEEEKIIASGDFLPDATAAANEGALNNDGEPLAGSIESLPNGSSDADGTTAGANDDDMDTPALTPKKMWSNIFYIGLMVKDAAKASGDGKVANGGDKRKLDISWPSSEFTKLVRSWDCFDSTSMSITVRCIKNVQLPLDVYDEDEKQKVLKKRGKSSKSRVSKEGPLKKRKSAVGQNLETDAPQDANNDGGSDAGMVAAVQKSKNSPTYSQIAGASNC